MPRIKADKPGLLFVAICALAFGLFLQSCAKETPRPDTAVIALNAPPAILDPRYSTDAVASKLGGLIYAGLFRINKSLETVPDLAESLDHPDPLTYIAHLKPGLKFQDGSPLTAVDVRYTIESVIDPSGASPKKSAFDRIARITAPDDRTVLIELKEPFAPFIDSLTIGIVKNGTLIDTKGEHNPIGAGPYMYESYRLNDELVLRKNPHYFGPAPMMDKLVFRIIPDETIRVLELMHGSVDLIMSPITPDLVSRFGDEFNVQTIPGTNFSYIGFNMQDPVTGNKSVRQAIAYAIDREKIIKFLLKGLAVPATGPFASSNFYSHSGEEKFKFDPVRAKKLLDEAGFPDPDGDGPKFRFTLKFKTSQDETRLRLAQVYQQQLADVGIDMQIQSYEWGTFFEDIKKGNFQLYSLTWVGIIDPDIMFYMFHSSSFPPDGANRGRYYNPELDKLLELGRAEQVKVKRKEIYAKVLNILLEDMPYVNLWYPVNIAVLNKRLTGFEIYPDESLASLVNLRKQGEMAK